MRGVSENEAIDAMRAQEVILIPRKGQMVVTDRAAAGRPAIDGHLMAASYLAAKRGIVRDNAHIGLVIDPLVTGQFLIGGDGKDAAIAAAGFSAADPPEKAHVTLGRSELLAPPRRKR